jgi:hypothetical protein
MQIQHINRTDPEKVFIIAYNNEGDELEPGKVVEWDQLAVGHTSTGLAVELVDAAVNLTTGLVAKVAGVVHTTISTAAHGLLQVYGVDTVRASASLASGGMVVASSINATNQGHVTEATTTTLTAPPYLGAVVGWLVEDSANATNAVVFLDLL